MASIKAIIFLTWIAFGLGTLVYAVLATEPNRIIIFKEPITDKALPDHVIRTEKVANEGSCRVKCYLEPNCVSVNVGPAEEGGHTCELNNATDESPMQSHLKKRKHYIHYAVENVCHAHGDPCPGENNLCQVGFSDKGYRCKCREGYEYDAAGNDCHDPCQSHRVLNNADRSVRNTAQNNVKCDQSSRELSPLPGWYRFTDAAGDMMPTECVPIKRCGTHSPGWLNGLHPTVQEGIVTREVCYHWLSSCCHRYNNIRIKNCSAYFVYELDNTPFCNLRYCGNNGGQY